MVCAIIDFSAELYFLEAEVDEKKDVGKEEDGHDKKEKNKENGEVCVCVCVNLASTAPGLSPPADYRVPGAVFQVPLGAAVNMD
jgi:hypothetical protein